MPYIIKTSLIIHSTEKGVLLGVLTKSDKIKYDQGEEPETKFRFWASKKLCQSDAEGFLLPEVWIADLEWNQKFLYSVPINNDDPLADMGAYEEEERAKECSYKEFLEMAEKKDLDIKAVDASSKKRERKKFRKEEAEPKETKAFSTKTAFDDIPF